MYLKSLVLKGFKSFADRSVLTLQPGITAIVGPNGSGKSNISDAVLWVLGERSARNLRGQAMDDIIFSGSAARKAVSIAEVDLVLDNSDHVLPVDFDEVVITRRMYRSGESEYLVNGVVARRLDVLDILHDSGLGTGTHSIISQGSLDSILQSKPEDRRALIEEAAGVLKHKRRKEKSARKLALMENHLARVRDVTAEVERQLGPLERKAKRAEAYKKARGELHEVRLALAVDDLRKLKIEWEAVCSAEREASASIDDKRRSVESAERKVSDYQELLRRESESASVVAKSQRRASSLSERLDSAERLLGERNRAAQDSLSTMVSSVEDAVARQQGALADLNAVNEQLSEVKLACEKAESRVSDLSEIRAEKMAKSASVEESLNGVISELAACERDWDAAKRDYANIQQVLANGVAQLQLSETRKKELEAELSRVREEHEASSEALRKAKENLDAIQADEGAAQEKLLKSFERREEAHRQREKANEDVHLAKAEAAAIEQALRSIREGDPALSWVIKNAERFPGELLAVSKAFKVTRGLESLVEQLLGHDLAALTVEDPASARRIVSALADEGVRGEMALIMRDDEAAMHQAAHVYEGDGGGHPLLEDITYAEQLRPVVEALLGDVVVCKDRESAFAAHARCREAVRFLSLDGCVVWPSGKVQVLGQPDAAAEGVIARERKLDDLNARLVELVSRKEQAVAEAETADGEYRSRQAEALKLSQQLANSKGVYESALAEEGRVAKRVDAAVEDLAHIERQMAFASQEIEAKKPGLEDASKLVDELSVKREQLLLRREGLAAEMEPLRAEYSRIEQAYSDARLEAATLVERRTYVQRLVVARERDLEMLKSSERNARQGMAAKNAAISRADDILDMLKRLAIDLGARVRVLDEALNASETSANSVHVSAAAAREEARNAHAAFESASSHMSKVQVDKSRLELRVEAAVKTIVDDLHTPIDEAQGIDVLEDRKKAEDDLFRLERKIRNMGTVNPDAAEEYAQVKERYDFLAGQLADMESAKRSLARISSVIDARMKSDFVRTFEQVNANFGEVFSTLFPGGSAHLSLENPDDLENTGVEVTAQPAGKRLTKMMLMSGGEKSLTALALLFAVYTTRTTPFYILDEVEAALDDTNLRRLSSYISTLRDTTQLIMITHQRRTMEMADVLFGVSMHSDGVTKVISQRLERALEQAE